LFFDSQCILTVALQSELLHLVHGNSVPEDQLQAFLAWYSAERPESRPPRMRSDNHEVRHDVDDSDNSNCQRRNKLERPSPPTGDNCAETSVAVMPNRWFLHATASTHHDVDSDSTSDDDGEHRDHTDARSLAAERTRSQPSSFDEFDDRTITARRHKYDSSSSWYERHRHSSHSDAKDDIAAAYLSFGGVAEHRDNDTADMVNITRHDDDDGDDGNGGNRRTTPTALRCTTSPMNRRRCSVDCATLHQLTPQVQKTQSDASFRQDVTLSHAEDRDVEARQDLSSARPPSRSQPHRSYSLSPMSPTPHHHHPPFNVVNEFRLPTTAAPPALPPGPLSHELVRHLREQQVLRLAAVSRAIHHQLRYLHHGGGSGATSPSGCAAGLYPPPSHRHHQFDANLLLGTGATTSYTLHDSIMPNFRAPDLALTSGGDSPGDSDVSNDNVSGTLLICRNEFLPRSVLAKQTILRIRYFWWIHPLSIMDGR